LSAFLLARAPDLSAKVRLLPGGMARSIPGELAGTGPGAGAEATSSSRAPRALRTRAIRTTTFRDLTHLAWTGSRLLAVGVKGTILISP